MTYSRADLTQSIEKAEAAMRDLELLEEEFKGVTCDAHVVKRFKEVSDNWDAVAIPEIFRRELLEASAYLIPEKGDTADFSCVRSKLGWIKREAERLLCECL